MNRIVVQLLALDFLYSTTLHGNTRQHNVLIVGVLNDPKGKPSAR